MNKYLKILWSIEQLYEKAIINEQNELNEIDGITKKNIAFIRRLNTQTKAQKQKNLIGIAKEKLDSFMNMNPIIFNNIINQKQFGLFRKYEGLSNEDKLSMIKNQKFLELLEQLEKEIDNAKDKTS